MNYGEELVLWYLRMNGFFPISNFAIHACRTIRYGSDCDVLAIRTPHVFEEVGGQDNDWDDFLRQRFAFEKTVGMICEVKTGDYNKNKLFPKSHLAYCIGHIGIIPQHYIGELANQLDGQQLVNIDSNYQIGKLLIAKKGMEMERYFCNDLESTISFLRQRIKKYPNEKYRNRMFFSSTLLQFMIDNYIE